MHEVAAPVVPVAAASVVTAMGRDACDSLPIDCVRAIASRQEEGQTIVYITPAETGRVRMGQWVHCERKDRPPSPPCEVLDIVDAGMLEARCGDAAPTCPPPPS
ncbi:hypothetical protein POL25_37050 [Nannocystis sp. bb15-2]|uniref:Uncharacterized protein n=1 Tax=Nannocystis bainbridge TaxID=2995303 RepID=A0ABT5E9M4_9BACT|nr:hypothetical protein [Nannocystis bainbridge]